MRGVKHWNYEQTKSMFEKLQPLIRQVLENITAESQMDYGTSEFSTFYTIFYILYNILHFIKFLTFYTIFDIFYNYLHFLQFS